MPECFSRFNPRLSRIDCPKQRRFVEEFLIDFNATQAAIRAGYSKKTARVIGPENLSKPAIADAVAEGVKKLSERAMVASDALTHELDLIAMARLFDVLDPCSRHRAGRVAPAPRP